MIALIGATGRIGSRLAGQLTETGHKVRALVRDPAKAALPEGVETWAADLDDPSTLAAGLAGVTALFLLSPQDPAQATREIGAIEAAKAAGVAHVVKLSGGAAMVGEDSESPVGRQHAKVEAALKASGLAWTILRPGAFMQVVLAPLVAQAREAGQILMPLGEGRVAFIDVDDIARAAAWALTHPAEAVGRELALTGPEALSVGDLAGLIGARLGRTVVAVSPPLEMAAPMIRARIGDDFLADHQLAMLSMMRDGRLSEPSGDLVAVTGRPGRSVAGWLMTVP